MIKQFANRIISFLIQENIILRDDAEIYRYGTEQILVNFMTFVVIGILATITGTWIETIFFFVGLIPIRMVAGGYHAKTPRICNVLIFSVYMANMILIHLMGNHMTYLLSYTGYVIILTIILMFAPVDHKNRVLNGVEITKARRASRIIGAVIMGFCMVISALFRSVKYFFNKYYDGCINSISFIICRKHSKRR